MSIRGSCAHCHQVVLSTHERWREEGPKGPVYFHLPKCHQAHRLGLALKRDRSLQCQSGPRAYPFLSSPGPVVTTPLKRGFFDEKEVVDSLKLLADPKSGLTVIDDRMRDATRNEARAREF